MISPFVSKLLCNDKIVAEIVIKKRRLVNVTTITLRKTPSDIFLNNVWHYYLSHFSFLCFPFRLIRRQCLSKNKLSLINFLKNRIFDARKRLRSM